MSEKRKKLFAVDREKRQARRKTVRQSARTYVRRQEDSRIGVEKVVEKSPERAENLTLIQEMTRAFIASIEYYKKDYGGSRPHDEAVEKSQGMNEWRREQIEGLHPEKIEWSHLAAVGEADVNDALRLWIKTREAADNELESGFRAGAILGSRAEPYVYAQFFAIRDSFADQWQPQGGIESAMIDMMAIAFSLQLYWSEVAHQRTDAIYNEQKKELNRYENNGWKSPYQREADAIEQAYRLADSYNRQFLRVLRQLRDLRRYSPIVIQNNGGQVNVGAQQVNVQES